MTLGGYQCDEPGCTADAVVYDYCVADAPLSWLERALNEFDDEITDEEREAIKTRLVEEHENYESMADFNEAA